jgi:peptide/nickel transport system permease protein
MAVSEVAVRPEVSAPIAGRATLRRLLASSRLGLLGAAIVFVVTLVSLVGFVAELFDFPFTPYGPLEQDLAARLEAPSAAHPLGTDELGRDILSRILAGAHFSLEVAVIVLSAAIVIGLLVGIAAGFAGGIVDEVLMRVTDLFLAFPALILAAAIAATLGPSLQTTMVALAVVFWPWYARLVRSQVLSLRQEEFVLAARTQGASTWHIMFRTLLPNVLPLIIVQAALDTGYVILSTSALSFLGLGAQPPTPEWGAMVLQAASYQQDFWWYPVFPGLALAVTALGFNLLGDGLRDWTDPLLRGSR